MTLTQNRFILDSDTGADDCVAVLLAGAFIRKRAAMLLATYGNYSLPVTLANLASSAVLAGFEQPVVAGPKEPLPEDCTPHVVPRGLMFTEYSEDFPAGLSPAQPEDFLAEVYETLKANAPCDYIAIGPLTGLAMLLRRYPDAVEHIGQVVIMGGGLELYNATPYSEYNIWCDALSAEEVFASGLPISMAGLDLCTPTALPEEEVERLKSHGGILGRCMGHIMQIENDLSDSFGNPHGIIYDALALSYYIRPEMFTTRQTGIRVITEGERYGQTVEDSTRSNVTVLETVDQQAYRALLHECLYLLEQGK